MVALALSDKSASPVCYYLYRRLYAITGCLMLKGTNITYKMKLVTGTNDTKSSVLTNTQCINLISIENRMMSVFLCICSPSKSACALLRVEFFKNIEAT